MRIPRLPLKAILTEAEPVSVETRGLVTVGGTKRTTPQLAPLRGLYEIHDLTGFTTLSDGETRTDQQARIIGSVDPLLVGGVIIQVGSGGPHAGRRYRLGAVSNLGSHIEADLEDV